MIDVFFMLLNNFIGNSCSKWPICVLRISNLSGLCCEVICASLLSGLECEQRCTMYQNLYVHIVMYREGGEGEERADGNLIFEALL